MPDNSSLIGMTVEVVSQNPGICGSVGPGKDDIDVGVGMCSQYPRFEARTTCAILELEIALNKVAIAFARRELRKTFFASGSGHLVQGQGDLELHVPCLAFIALSLSHSFQT